MSLLFKISYGLYVLSASYDGNNNACMINTLSQQTSNPERLTVTLNKGNHTHDMIANSGECSVALLSEETTFTTIKNFGMQSGRDADKFAAIDTLTTDFGRLIPANGILGYFDLKVESTVDFGTHTMFVCSVLTAKELPAKALPLTYGYYHSNVKPKPAPIVQTEEEEVWVCKICGYIHKGPLPADFVCPVCKHGAVDFERVYPKKD